MNNKFKLHKLSGIRIHKTERMKQTIYQLLDFALDLIVIAFFVCCLIMLIAK